MVDQLQDKTDNVAVIVDAEGETLEDYYDVGNRAMYQKVPDYVNRRNVQVIIIYCTFNACKKTFEFFTFQGRAR